MPDAGLAAAAERNMTCPTWSDDAQDCDTHMLTATGKRQCLSKTIVLDAGHYGRA